jgi:hypothetical protein
MIPVNVHFTWFKEVAFIEPFERTSFVAPRPSYDW